MRSKALLETCKYSAIEKGIATLARGGQEKKPLRLVRRGSLKPISFIGMRRAAVSSRVNIKSQ